jgi:hypothetical protein
VQSATFRQLLTNHFDDEELRTLCVDLGNIDYDSLDGRTKSAKVRSLLGYMARHGRFPELVNYLQKARPKLGWPGESDEVEALAAHYLAQHQADTLSPNPGPSIEVKTGGDVNAPVTINAPTTNIHGDFIHTDTSLDNGRQKRLLFLLLVVAVVILGGVAALVMNVIDLSPPLNPPEAADLKPIPATKGLSVTAMVWHDNQLYFGAEKDGKSVLHQMDADADETAIPTPVHTVTSTITDLIVDCHENIWLLLNEIGVFIYSPRQSPPYTLVNAQSSGNRLPYNTQFAIAEHCQGDQVTIWLGRKGVYPVQYQGDYPMDGTVQIDEVIPGTASFNDVKALYYDDNLEVLWVANSAGELLGVPSGLIEPQSHAYSGGLLLALAGNAEEIWVGGNEFIGRIMEDQTVSLQTQNDKTYGLASALTVFGDWVWFGGRCSEDAVDCRSLGVYSRANKTITLFDTQQTITSLVADPNGNVWIGTSNGLIYYPASE